MLGARIAKRYKLICFDEFHVADITDAMILHRLLAAMFANGVGFVTTSNFKPDDLYPNGLHRDRILPAIALLNARLEVVNVDNGTDYRRRTLEQVQLYHTPLGGEADAAMSAAFDRLAEVRDEDPVLHIESREIEARRRAGGVVWFDFKTLCGGPRSQNDYLEIATQFHTVLLSDVPHMPVSMASPARRFTWLIDVLYDRRVKLIMSACCAARRTLYRRTAGARVSAHGLAPERNAVQGVSRTGAARGGYWIDMRVPYLRLLPLCLALQLPAAHANARAEDGPLKDQRAAIAERLVRQEAACYQQFDVNGCLRRVRQQDRSDRDALQSRENSARERVRLERSAKHQQAQQEKRAAAAMAAPAPHAKSGTVRAPGQSQSALRARAAAADNVLAERATKQRARAAQAAVAQQRQLEKQRTATERKQARARRQAERDGKGDPAIAPLPEMH